MLARNVTASLLAILTAIWLQPGRKYRLSVAPLVLGEVTSGAGAAAFSGTESQSAVDQDGPPSIKMAVWEALL